MGACTATLLALVACRGALPAPHDAYGGTCGGCSTARRGHFKLELADLTTPDAPGHVAEVSPDLLWIETPSNPLLAISDVRALAGAAHAGEAVVVVDNTFCSPVVQRPLERSADVVVQSSTKYQRPLDVIGVG